MSMSLERAETETERRLRELREKHGFIKPGLPSKRQMGRWSKQKIADGREALIVSLRESLGERANDVLSDEDFQKSGAAAKLAFVPNNRYLLDLLTIKFAEIGFSWKAVMTHREVPCRDEGRRPTGGKTTVSKPTIVYTNFPKIGGRHLTLHDLITVPIELIDGYTPSRAAPVVTSPIDVNVQAMDATGIGYKGLLGVSWRPLAWAFRLPTDFEDLLMRVGAAIFTFCDAVQVLTGKDPALDALLGYKVPARIPRITGANSPQRVRIIRPDMVIVEDEHGLRPVITELESCPGGHGMTHAMQVGYGLAPDMVDAFVRHLNGRAYTVFATHQWAEYVFDQAVLCVELRKRGIDARIVFDRPLDEVARVARGWLAPKGVAVSSWDTDVLARLERLGFLPFVQGINSPDELDELSGAVFRFGYLDNFSSGVVQALTKLEYCSVIEVLNPPWFYLESKAFMAAARLPSVRARMEARSPGSVALLDACLAETRVLGLRNDIDELVHDRAYWITKFAGFDAGNQSWGARSLDVGAQMSPSEWKRALEERMALNHPVVAQHVINGKRFDAVYLDPAGKPVLGADNRTRLTPFFLRGANGKVQHCGSMITLRAGSYRVHGATDAIEGPVVFGDKEGRS